MRRLLLLLALAVISFRTSAQELYVNVQVLAPTVPNINKTTLTQLQTTISNFLNNNKWSKEIYLPQERIFGNLIITINSWDASSTYSATAQLQSRRAVYGSTYQSTLLNLSDKDFNFSYNEGQPLEYGENNFQSNLSSLLSFYAFIIVGLDKDSFSPLAGSPYFKKAQQVLQLAQNSGFNGWSAADGLRNRYWLNENLLDNNMEPIRLFSYQYHRKGIDLMQQQPLKAIEQMRDVLPLLQQIDKQQLGAIYPNTFLSAKAEEFVNIFSMANPQDRIRIYNLLTEIDPANSSKYDKLKALR